MADLGFDANVEDAQPISFDLIPGGWYEAIIEDSEKRTGEGSGKDYIGLTFQLLGPTHAGRKLWVNLNFWSDNPTAVNIAKGTMNAIQRAVRVPVVRDTTQLHSLPMLIKVGQKPDKRTGEMKNVINDYKAKDGSTVTAPTGNAPTPGASAAPAPAGGGAAPWAPKKATG